MPDLSNLLPMLTGAQGAPGMIAGTGPMAPMSMAGAGPMPQVGGDGAPGGPGVALLANPQLRNQLLMNMMAQQGQQMDQAPRPGGASPGGTTGGFMSMLGGQGGLLQSLGGQGGLMQLLQRIGQPGATPMGQGGIGHA